MQMLSEWEPILPGTRGNRVREILSNRARSGPDGWTRAWPDDERVLWARDRLSRAIRYHCAWPNELFLPGDSFDDIRRNWDKDGFDEAEIVMEIEDLFDIEYPEDSWSGCTYLEFIERYFERLVDFEKYDARACGPLALPAGHYAPGLWNAIKRRFPGIGTDRSEARALRSRQASRVEAWRGLWPDDPAIEAARERAGTILAQELDWFDGAFVPDDRLEALLLPFPGSESVTRAVAGLNQAFPGARLVVKNAAWTDCAFGELVKRLADCAARYDVSPFAGDGRTRPDVDPVPWKPLEVGSSFPEWLREKALRDRAESGGENVWRRMWPNEPDILEARDRMSRLLRQHCGWPNELFIPSDSLNAITMHMEYEPFEPAQLVIDLEDLFGFEIPVDEQWGGEYTYLDFLLIALGEGHADYEKFDAEAFRPFVLRDGYHDSWWVRRGIRFGASAAKGSRNEFHRRQLRRAAKWRDHWPDDPALIAARDAASAILVAELGWFNDAFIPEDRLDALLADARRKRVRRAADAFRRQFPGFVAEPRELAKSPLTYGRFLAGLVARRRIDPQTP